MTELSSENKSEIYLLSLEEAMQDAPMPLMQARLEHPQDDMLITWQVEVDVKTRGVEHYLVCVALHWDENNLDALRAMAEQCCSPSDKLIYASINVAQYGDEHFAILIEQTEFGEVLINSLVQEVIEKAAIEEAVVSWSSD